MSARDDFHRADAWRRRAEDTPLRDFGDRYARGDVALQDVGVFFRGEVCVAEGFPRRQTFHLALANRKVLGFHAECGGGVH